MLQFEFHLFWLKIFCRPVQSGYLVLKSTYIVKSAIAEIQFYWFDGMAWVAACVMRPAIKSFSWEFLISVKYPPKAPHDRQESPAVMLPNDMQKQLSVATADAVAWPTGLLVAHHHPLFDCTWFVLSVKSGVSHSGAAACIFANWIWLMNRTNLQYVRCI